MVNTEEAILDLIKAMGPQEFNTILAECENQATDNPNTESVNACLDKLVIQGYLKKVINQPCDIFPNPWTVWGFFSDF